MIPRILLVEDEPNMVRTLTKILERRSYHVATASNGREALNRLDEARVDVVITDLNMPAMDGLSLLREIQKREQKPATLVLTGYGTIASAVEAMKLGAADYLIKPCNPDELLLSVERQLEVLAMRQELRTLRREMERHQRYGDLIGNTPPMREVYRIIETVSQNKSTVLVSGPSGTGKELVARTLHSQSPWSRGPFIAINCAAVSETLLDSQLFGHRRGAFTGAIADQEGVFEAASGGTLFLDEVSEIPQNLQAKFLRALQEREVIPLGATRPTKVDVRIVAATNQDLALLVRAGTFRDDLFYRLNVVTIDLPPLAQRRGDIAFLADHFIQDFAKTYNVAPKVISPETSALFLRYDWPGNVRELQNTIERAFAMSTSPSIDASDVPMSIRAIADPRPAEVASGSSEEPMHSESSGLRADRPMRPGQPAQLIRERVATLDEAERAAIAAALAEACGNKNEAARLLNIDRQRLYRKIEKYELS